jgi:thioredoxin-like negative regulator of GroEL
MANEDLHQEIELLRQQLDAIQRESNVPPPEPPEASAGAGPDDGVEATVTAEEEAQAEDLLAQLKELLESIDRDIKDTKPTTLLIVFALGVLVGRL